MITTVIFDLDDTLYDEVEYCRSGFHAVADFLAQLPDWPTSNHIFDALWDQFEAGNHTKTFNAALDEFGKEHDEKLISKLVELYRNHIPKITLPTDSRDVLDQLSGRYTLALLTDGFLPAQQLKVHALGIEKYFKTIVYTEMLGRDCWKPSPAGFKKLIQKLNANPENMVYVADNQQKDFIAPNSLGLSTIQIIRPSRIHTQSSQNADAAPGYTMHKITELFPLLSKL